MKKGDTMNFGTKLRTALRIATSLQTAFALTATAITDTGNQLLILVWVGFAIACDFAVGAITTYYNCDYTEEACKATGLMRLEKAENNMDDIEGEDFFNMADEIDPDAEDFDDEEETEDAGDE